MLSLYTAREHTGHLGDRDQFTIDSSVGPFHRLSDHRTVYPAVVGQALGDLYQEYNLQFRRLREANTEWETDYQYCLFGPSRTPVNFAVQIDMVGLPQSFLEHVSDMSVDEVRKYLKHGIFEIENSLAMYQLLERSFENGEPSFFKVRFRAALNALRTRFGKPMALLAVTDEKYDAMLSSEFGKAPGQTISNDEVLALSGFDAFLSPDQFRSHLARNGGACQYLLYVRSSDPVHKLRRPGTSIVHPLLDDPDMRRIIKANSLTMNIDAPDMPTDRRINDTKGYMAPMGMAFEISDVDQLMSQEMNERLSTGQGFEGFEGQVLSQGFAIYLAACNVNPNSVISGETQLRAKPRQGTYGCYGHLRGPLGSNKKFRAELRKEMKSRGSYVIQPEMTCPIVLNEVTGRSLTYIDRNFMAWTGEMPVFLGGFRSMLDVNSHEASRGRNHGNGDTIWAEIVD